MVLRVPELPPPPAADGVRPTPVPSVLGVGARVRAWVVGGGAGEAAAGSSPGAAAGVAGRLGAVLGGALAVVVVAVVGWRAFAVGGGAAGPPPELSMPRATTSGTDGGGAGASGGAGVDAGAVVGAAGSGGAGGSQALGSIVVAHVAGAVARPGLYRLGGSPRIADAIDAAGGPATDADLDQVNLAAPVADGERVYVPRRGESPPPVAGAGGGPSAAAAGPLDLNTATAEQLEDLPGVGPSTAAAILAYRQEHGRFRSVDELLEVRGIGEARLAELRPKVRVR